MKRMKMANSPLEALGSDRSNQQLELLIAVHKFRQEIEDLLPKSSKSMGDWNLGTIQKMSEIFINFLDAVASETEEADENGSQYVYQHLASSVLSEFILALEDLKIGVIDRRLRGQTNLSGNRKNLLEEKLIGYGLMLVDMLHYNKKRTIKDARIKAAAILKKNGLKMGDKEITASNLQEWSRDYNLDGSRK
jgi:hypothetical protein